MTNDENAAAMKKDNPLTWFERIKACQTPEEMAELLDNGSERAFCPFCGCPPGRGNADRNCHDCIVAWLCGEE